MLLVDHMTRAGFDCHWQRVDTVQAKRENEFKCRFLFTPAGRRRCRSVERDAQWLRAVVTDTGVGIVAADQPRLFNEFERIETNGERRDGTGLGFAQSRRLAVAR